MQARLSKMSFQIFFSKRIVQNLKKKSVFIFVCLLLLIFICFCLLLLAPFELCAHNRWVMEFGKKIIKRSALGGFLAKRPEGGI